MHPILFSAGPFTLRTYGLMMALSFVLGLVMAAHLNRKEGRSDEELMDLTVWIMVGAVVGARILYVAVEWPQFWGPLAPPTLAGRLINLVAVWRGGLVYYGGFAGAWAAAWAFLRARRAPLWSYADVLAPGLALGQVTGRIGCFFNGCCYGIPSARYGLVFPAIGDGVPHLPTQLYEAAFCLALSAGLVRLWRRRSYAGQVFGTYVLAYSVWRFLIEFLRGDAARGVLFSPALSPSQWISLGTAAVGVGLLLALRRRDGAPVRA